MKITETRIPIREIIKNYIDNDEEGVFGYDGKLNIRPPYQREFIYDNKKREAVIDTIRKNFPLNTIYFSKNNDDSYELLDGQQRIVSICQYVTGIFSFDYQFFHNLTKQEQDQILNYELMVYICEGDEREKLEWFKVINIASLKLTDQELRNAIYAGSWLTSAKKYFSKRNCPAYEIGKDYLVGSPIRQDYLETVLKWYCGGKIEEYMAQHQHDDNADDLWLYFRNIIDWVKRIFPNYRKEMKGIDWGYYYNEYGNMPITKLSGLKNIVEILMSDPEVTNKKGIYDYVFTGKERYLNLRQFDENTKRQKYEEQQGKCVICGKEFPIEEMEADHITPWSQGGKTETSNCQILCRECNRRKGKK